MTYDELISYWRPARDNLLEEKGSLTEEGWSSSIWLDKMLGVVEYKDFYRTSNNMPERHRPLPEDLKQLLIMLAGPHGKTILKAYRIQRGLE